MRQFKAPTPEEYYTMQNFARWAAILVIVTVGITSGIAGSLAADEPTFAAKLRLLIHAKMQEWVTPGVLVYVDIPGQETWIEGFGVSDIATKAPMSADQHHRIGSVTKTLTATAILLLVEEGKIGLDDAVSSETAFFRGGHAPLRQAAMSTTCATSGLVDVELAAAFQELLALDAHASQPLLNLRAHRRNLRP